MGTPTKPKKWKSPSEIGLHPIPDHLTDRVSVPNMVKKEARLNLVQEHLPAASPAEQEKLAEAIEKAARACRHADEYDKRPRTSHINARLEKLQKSGNKFLKELVECDELTASYIETRSKNIYSQQKILSEPSATTGLPLSDTLTYVVPFEDLSDQVSYYLKMIEIGAVEWTDKPGPQPKTVLTALVKELAVGWKEATGAEAKGNSKFIDFVCEVSGFPSIRRIVRPGEGYRRKVRAAMNKVLA
jgi:hypothetical protein